MNATEILAGQNKAIFGYVKNPVQAPPPCSVLRSPLFGFLVLPDFFQLLVLLGETEVNTPRKPKVIPSSSGSSHLLFELLIHGCLQGSAVLLVGLHLLVELLFRHLAEVVVLLHGLLQHLLLMLALFSQVLQDLRFVVLEQHSITPQTSLDIRNNYQR